MGEDELFDEWLADLFFSLAPVLMRWPGGPSKDDREKALATIKGVLRDDLHHLRDGGDDIRRDGNILICRGVRNPQTEEEVRGALHAVNRLGQTELLYIAGFADID